MSHTRTEPFVRADSPAQRWSIHVPIVESERFRTTSDKHNYSPTTSEQPMEVESVNVSSRQAGNKLFVSLSGPNVKADGTTGKKTYSLTTSTAELREKMPRTYDEVLVAANALIASIGRNAERAIDQINLVKQ